MKPGLKDKKYYILITGKELIELKKYACMMVEARWIISFKNITF